MEFPPIDGTGKIAYSGDGLTLLDPPSSQIARIHSLSSEGLKGWDTGIRWSPDGSRIVFLYSEKGRQPNPEVIVLIADLTVGRICTLISEPGRYSTPAWSPDGNQIVLTDPSTGGLIIVNIYNRTTTVLENDVQEGTSAQWISDQAILYVRKNQEGKNDLVLRSMDGSPSSAIVQNVNGLRDFLMSPDRQYLTYYASGLTLNNTIRKEEVKIGDMLPVAWSNDGQMLFAKAGLSGIYLLKSQDNFTELPIPVWGFIGRQSLSQDNRFLALEIAGDGTKLSQLGILELATNELRIIDLPDLYPSDPAWNPKME